MKCKYCGCTDGRACVGGCHWIGPETCSNCVMYSDTIQKELEAYIDDPNVNEIIVQIKDEDKSKKRFIVLKRGK